MQIRDEIAAEKARPLADDAPGYTSAQQSGLSDLAFGHLSHRDMANKVRMLLRTDWQHESVVVAARDRIAWLAGRVEQLEVALQRLADNEADYRHIHDLHGEGDIKTGRAWAHMRHAGDEARALRSPKVGGDNA